MIKNYLFEGTILPERAQISLKFQNSFKHSLSGKIALAKVSILLNKVSIVVESEDSWNIFDLRNVVKNILKTNLALFGLLKGHVYDLDISRVINHQEDIDYVFGIDLPCIAALSQTLDFDKTLNLFRDKLVGKTGIFLHRSILDFVSAMKEAEDTGFYCYRAIESIRQHFRETHTMNAKNKEAQWLKLKEYVQWTNDEGLKRIKDSADPTRHGEYFDLSDQQRIELLSTTWEFMIRYFKKC